MSLRSKSLLALWLACLLALLLAAVFAWRIVQDISDYFAQVYARNYTQLKREQILGPVGRELALSMRLADSELTKAWLRHEDDPAYRAAFMLEAEGYRRDFRDHAYFAVVDASRNYYYRDATTPPAGTPRFFLKPDKFKDSWYFAIMKGLRNYSINVGYDPISKATKVYINCIVTDRGERIGMVGGALDLTAFQDEFIRSEQSGVTPMIVNARGVIQAHPDASLVVTNSIGMSDDVVPTIFRRLDDDASRAALRAAMQRAASMPGSTEMATLALFGKRQLVALSYIADMQWYVLTAVDTGALHLLNPQWLWTGAITLAALMLSLLIGFGYAVERVVLRPLRSFQKSVELIAEGRYEVQLPLNSRDEIGALARAFMVMLDKVRSHTDELETKVRERTAELEALNRTLTITSTHDSLTGLANRRLLAQRLQDECGRVGRGGPDFTVALLDIDHFKQVNDEFGHQAGDEVLVAVAGAIQGQLREYDLCGRWGGEEFLLLLPQSDLGTAGHALERVREAIAAIRLAEYPELKVTASAGIARYRRGEKYSTAINRADGALLDAKRSGRDRCIVAD